MSIIESENTAYYNRMIKQLEERGIMGWKLEVLETDRKVPKFSQPYKHNIKGEMIYELNCPEVWWYFCCKY